MGKVFTQPLLSWALRSGQSGWMNSAASVVANAGEKQVAIKTMPAIECPTRRENLSGYIFHTILGSHVWATLQRGQPALAMSRLPKRKRNKSGYVTSTIFGVPKARGESKWLHHLWRIGAHVWAEFPQNHCHLGIPRKGRKSKWRHKECPLGGPRVGALDAWHLPPWGPKSGNEIKVSTQSISTFGPMCGQSD